MSQEEDDASNTLNHISILYEELERDHGRLSRKGGVRTYELVSVCDRILANIGDAVRTGVADLDRTARKASYWTKVRAAHLHDAAVLAESHREQLDAWFDGSTLEPKGKIVEDIVPPTIVEEDKNEEDLSFLTPSFLTPSDLEWAEEMSLYSEVRDRIVRALLSRGIRVIRHEVDSTHIIRLWLETEVYNQAPNIFTVINNLLMEYPSYEPEVVVHLTSVRVERTETKSRFSLGKNV